MGSKRTAVVLAGGQGARLQPYTMVFPKPLLPLGNVPIAEVLIRQLVAAGFERIVVTLRYMSPIFRAFFAVNSGVPLPIEFVEEANPLGTAGSLSLVPDLPEHFLVVNGDTLTDLDFENFYLRHVQGNVVATVALAQREIKIDYGVVSFDEAGNLEDYSEKPRMVRHISTGIYMLSRDCLEFITHSAYLDMPNLLVELRDRGRAVKVYVHDGYWKDIGRFEDYQEASADFTVDPGRFCAALSQERLG